MVSILASVLSKMRVDDPTLNLAMMGDGISRPRYNLWKQRGGT